jgi:hypothetical protein
MTHPDIAIRHHEELAQKIAAASMRLCFGFVGSVS